MTAKQQQAIFSQAFSRHQGAKTPEEFLQALELYRQAASKGSHTFPLHFNMASVYLSLSQMATQQESTSLRQKAADHLDAALTLLPNNLEALVARAAVEDAFARACQPQEILAFRERASTFLRRGADAESKDASVRILLAEALVLLAEASKCRGPTDIINVLGQAESALREAEWILDEREVDLRRQPPNETATTSVRTDRGRARMVLGNIALARVRLTDMDNVEAVKMLRTTEEVMRGSDLDAETAVVRGEVIEAIAERLECTERKECLLEAGRMYRMGIGTDRRIEVFSLLGDVCLALARGGTDAAVGEGVQAYETAVKEGDLAVETLYNMACLLAIGVGQRASEDAERRIGALLKQGVNAGGVSLAELRQDEDLRNVRQKEWFQKLLQYTERRNSKQ